MKIFVPRDADFRAMIPPADSALGNLGFSQQENGGFAGKIESSPRTK